MDERHFEEFAARMVGLAELFNVEFSAARLALYFEALRDLSFDQVVMALNRAVKTCTFVPKPAELRTMVLGDDDERVEQAWLLVRAAMLRAGAYATLITADAAIGQTILAMFASWPRACAAELSPEMWAARRKEFARVYAVMHRRGQREPAHLPGLVEAANAGQPEWFKHVPFVFIGRGATDIQPLTAGQVSDYFALAPGQRHEFQPSAAIVRTAGTTARAT
jgi:hypothetical protein